MSHNSHQHTHDHRHADHQHDHAHSQSNHSHSHHDHDHHDHSHIPNNKKILTISFILITLFMVAEFVGGYLTNSLALISDAGHMLSDSVALGIALFAVFLGEKASNARKSFGYQRFEILAAAINGITLVAISIYIFIEAILRLQTPEDIHVQGMLIIASLGLLINIIVAWMMFRGSDTEHDLNMRGAFLHVLSDLLGSVGAIIAALCIYFFSWQWADTVASVLVALLVLRSGWSVVKQSTHVLMQGTPERFDVAEIQAQIMANDRILDVHDLHIWSLSSKRYILSCHIVVDDQMTMQNVQSLLHEVEQSLQAIGIEHVTIQTETRNHQHAELDF